MLPAGTMKVAALLILATQFLTISCVKQSSFLSPPWKNCLHRLNAKRSWQEFVSPGYPHGINTQTQCSWIISANLKQRVKLAFYKLNLTGSINNCFTQSVEILDFKTGTSMGRFCGDIRPGDYVTYGYLARVDLKADTAAAGHQGFMIKYKLTKEPGGFKTTFSFQNKPTKPKKKQKTKDKKNTGKFSENPLFNTNGGRVNLGKRKKLREKGIRKSAEAKSNVKKHKPAVVHRKPAPIRTLQHQQVNTPVNTPGIINIIIEDEEESLPFEKGIIILIGAGVLLFLIFLGFLTWFCFCRKRESREEDAIQHAPTKTPLDAEPHPIQRRHELPRMPPSTTEPIQPISKLQGPMQSFYMPPAAPLPLQALPQRAKTKSVATSIYRHGNHMSKNNSPETVFKNSENGDTNKFQNQLITSFKGGYLYHYPNKSPDSTSLPVTAPVYQTTTSSSSSDERIVTENIRRRQSYRRSAKNSKKIPTMKRKFSQWEKDEIKKGTLKC